MKQSKRLTRRDFLRLSAITATGAAIAACAPAAPEVPKVEKEAPKEKAEVEKEVVAEKPAEKVKIVTWQPDSDAWQCLAGPEEERFNEESEGVEVDVILKPGDYNELLRASLAGGVAPDVYKTPGPSRHAELALAGQCLDLDPFVAQFRWDELFLPWCLSLGQVEGTLYSLGDELETLVLYYNKTLFEDNGWEVPTTTIELYTLCEKIQTETDIIPLGGEGIGTSNDHHASLFLNHDPGPQKCYDALTKKIPWTDPAFVSSLDTFLDGVNAGYWLGSVEAFMVDGHTPIRSAWANGEIAMYPTGTWVGKYLHEFFPEGHPYEWDWAPFPAESGDEIFTIGLGGTQGINAATKHPEASAEFLNFYFSAGCQARMYRDCGLAPSAIYLTEADMEGVDPGMADLFIMLLEASKIGNYGYTVWTFWPAKSAVYVYEELEKVFVGDMTSEEYLEGLEKLYKSEEPLPLPER